MDTALEIKDLVVSYDGTARHKRVLDGLSLTIKPGEVFGLLGPNGAGKTTLIKSIVGLINATSGKISIFGFAPSSLGAKAKIGYMPEVANYYWFMTPFEILSLFGELSSIPKGKARPRIDEVLKAVGLFEVRDKLVRTFSKGMQERLNIAQAILHDPDLLILDEPFSGLDPLGRIDTRNILKGLKERNKTIILSSHELSEAELICDTISIMREGKVLRQGSLKELLSGCGGRSLENYFLGIIQNA